MFSFNDPETLWLSVTNIALAAVTLICLAVVARAVVMEIRARKKRRAGRVAEEAGHSLYVSELGLTMADGGQKINSADGDKKASTPEGK